MGKKRVLLVCPHHLLGESMEQLLRGLEDVELVGPWEAGTALCARIPEVCPDVIVVVEEQGHNDSLASLTGELIEAWPELPVIRASLTENNLRIFSTHLLPARTSDLLEAIRDLPAWQPPPAGDQISKGDASDANPNHPLVLPAPPHRHPGAGDNPDGAGRALNGGPG